MIRAFRCLAILVALVPTAARAQVGVQGAWEGAIHVVGQNITMRVDFVAADKATIDIQGATGLTATNVKIDGASVHFELVAGGGLCVFEGTLKDDAITGSFTQGPAKGAFDLTRAKPPAPEPPPPYKQEEVTITNGAIKLAGTLTIPPTAGRHPAVVLITGSGAENRDEDVFGFKVFRVLADQLTRAGIAVLRCDDRGVGGSTGSVPDSTSEDFATDVLADVAYLASRSDIDPKRIGLIGHSEGGLIAPIAASRSPRIAFIVLMSGPALPGDKILVAQGEHLLKLRGASTEAMAKQAESQQRVFEAARTNSGWDDVEKQFKADIDAQAAKVPEAQRAAMQQAGYQQVEAQLKSARTPWFRFFLTFDPATVLVKVRCPVLAYFGELDFQVPADVNKPALEQVMAKSGNRDVTIKVLPKANHLYQEGNTGDFAEYAVLKKEFVPDLVPTMTAWIQAHVKK